MNPFRPLPFLLLAVLAVACAGKSDEEAVQEAFQAYKTAILEDRGTEAATFLSEGTVAYYGEMRDLALHATREELAEVSMVDLMQAILMRVRIPTDDLQGMSGRQVLTHAVNEGWVGKNSVSGLEVEGVTVNGDDAALTLTGTTEEMHFHRESDGAWRLDLRRTLVNADVQLEMTARQNNMTREEFVLTVVGSMAGAPLDDSVWEPPLPHAGT